MDLSLDPMHGKGNQPDAYIRVVALDGFHQADVTFLNQIALWQPVAGVAARDADHEAQMGHDQLTRCFEVVFVAKSLCQRPLLVLREHRDATDGAHVRFQRSGRHRDLDIQRGTHGWQSPGFCEGDFSTLAIRVLSVSKVLRRCAFIRLQRSPTKYRFTANHAPHQPSTVEMPINASVSGADRVCIAKVVI